MTDLRDVTITEKTATSTRTEVFRMDISDKKAYEDAGLHVWYKTIDGDWHKFIKAAIVSEESMPVLTNDREWCQRFLSEFIMGAGTLEKRTEWKAPDAVVDLLESKLREVRDEEIERCAAICDARVQWTPPLSHLGDKISNETAYLLGKSMRSRKGAQFMPVEDGK